MTSRQPVLSVFVGAGGVGKTTLAAAYALSAAKSGRKVGLLSIDPAKRLKTALGLSDLTEEGTLLPLPFSSNGEVRAALLHVEETLKRWVSAQGLPPNEESRLLNHVFFRALSQRLASATDTFAAARMAEWREQYPDLDELVVDTAPGIHAMDFLVKPERLTDFFDSKIVDWIKWAVNEDEKHSLISGIFRSGTRKILDGLAVLGGRHFLVSFGELLILLEQVAITMARRIGETRDWLRAPSTQFCLVASVREDSVVVAQELALMLQSMGIFPYAAILNRTISRELRDDEGFVRFLQASGSSESLEKMLWNYARNYLSGQEQLLEELRRLSTRVIELPVAPGLDGAEGLRLADLAALGDRIHAQMAVASC